MPVAHIQDQDLNIIQIKTSVPTYLKEFLLHNEVILLVFDKRNSTIVEQDIISPKSKHEEDDLELTGNPLKVDLGGDESFGLIVDNIRHNTWTSEEAKHYPLPLNLAQKFVNKHNQFANMNQECLPLYVVCDGSDSLHTVILGSHVTKSCISTSSIYILNSKTMESEAESLQEMVNEHRRNARCKSAEIEFLIRMSYLVYGSYLRNCINFDNSDNYSSVSVCITSKKCVFRTPQGISDLKMNLQVFIGHKCSSLYNFWEELYLLYRLINILSCPENYNDEKIILSTVHTLCESEVFSGITNLLSATMTKTKIIVKEFALQNLREDTFFDKLWKILKCCDNVGSLRNAFHFLFEGLTDLSPTIIIRDDDNSDVSSIVSGIADGKLFISSITFPQALELLIELGMEKLKYDYQAILKHFYPSSEQYVNAKWSKLHESGAASTQASIYRKTRITQNLKSLGIKLENSTNKLHYLAQLHIAAEFYFLIKEQVNLTESSYDHCCESLSEKYTIDTYIDDFTDLLSNRVREFSFQLNGGDTKIIERLYPVKWAMQMKSTVKPYQNVKHGMEIITVYSLSQNQIFPTQIYNNYEFSSKNEEEKDDKELNYYAMKMIVHRDYCN